MKQKPSESGIGVLVGRRLREIRKAAGLSLRSVSQRMAPKGKGYQNVLLWLEQGRYASPSIVLIADYLRACRAKFADIADVLEDYVRQVPEAEAAARKLVSEAVAAVPEPLRQEVIETDARLAQAGSGLAPEKPGRPKKVLSPQERVERARRLIARRFRRIRLEEALYQVISVPEAKELSAEQLAALCRAGRKRFQILERTRGGRSRRQKQLAKEAKRVGGSGLPRMWVRAVADAVDRLFAELERSGALDRLPSAKDFGPGFRGVRFKPVPGAEKRLKEEQRQRLRAQGLRRAAAEAMLIAELDPKLRFSRMTGRERHWYLALLREMFEVALRYDSSPRELEQTVRRLVSSSRQPEVARALYEQFKAVFPKARALALGGRAG